MDRPAHGMTQAEVEEYRRQWGAGPHLAADLAVVSVPLGEEKPTARLLLIRRLRSPYAGSLALPGGFVELDEDLEHAARRELGEETGLSDLGNAWVEQLQSYGRPGRDPRARVISVVYLSLVAWNDLPPAQAGDDASEAQFYRFQGDFAFDDAGEVMPMAFDHELALRDIRTRLRILASYSSAPMLLVREPFTLQEARAAYEALLEHPVDADRFEAWIAKQRWLKAGPRGWELRSRRPEWMRDSL